MHIQEIRDFIIDNFLFGEGGNEFSNDDSFLEKGIIDSTGILELIAFLEQTYSIKIDDGDLVPANLDSVNRAFNFVNRKLQLKENGVRKASLLASHGHSA